MCPERLRNKNNLLILIWGALLLGIPVLSIFGRNLQFFLADMMSRQTLAWLISSILLILTIKALVLLLRQRPVANIYHMLWFVPLFLIVPWFFPIVEERVHFIVFGLFGFFSLLLLPLQYAYGLCLLVAGADEGLQWLLPDRVGDWSDVAVNLLAAWAGATFALVSRHRTPQAV